MIPRVGKKKKGYIIIDTLLLFLGVQAESFWFLVYLNPLNRIFALEIRQGNKERKKKKKSSN